VTNRKPRVAGEVVSFCTKCGLDLVHVVVAMVGGVPKRVLCRTCKSEHAYRKPHEQTQPKATGAVAPIRARAPGDKDKTPAARPSETEAMSARERAWAARVAGQPPTAFRAYSPMETFEQDQVIRHGKFGDGYVARVIDATKLEVMFRDGPRTLAQGIQANRG
jgi:hypothetical protein